MPLWGSIATIIVAVQRASGGAVEVTLDDALRPVEVAPESRADE